MQGSTVDNRSRVVGLVAHERWHDMEGARHERQLAELAFGQT